MSVNGKNKSQDLHGRSGEHERRHGPSRIQQKERRYDDYPSGGQQKKSSDSHVSSRLLWFEYRLRYFGEVHRSNRNF